MTNYTQVYGIKIEREQKTVNLKTYNNFWVKGELMGEDITICFNPPPRDTGGYRTADKVFGEQIFADLIVEKTTTDRGGDITTYLAEVMHEYEGMQIPMQCVLRPRQKSDEMMLNNLVTYIKAKQKKQAEEQEQAAAGEAGAEQQAMAIDEILPDQGEDKPKAKTKKE